MESEKKVFNLNKLITVLGIIIVILVVLGIYLSNIVNDMVYVSVKNYGVKVRERSQKLFEERLLVGYELTDKEQEMYNKYMEEQWNESQDIIQITENEKKDDDCWASFKALYKESKEVEQ